MVGLGSSWGPTCGHPVQPGAQFCDICGQPSVASAGGQLDPAAMPGPGSPAAPPPPPPGSRQGWLSPPPDIHFPAINPDAADDPWASWYGKPKGSRDESPSATLPRVTPPPGGRPSQQYDAQGYADGTAYVPAPPYVAPQQTGGPWGDSQPYDGAPYGPGDQFGGGPGYGATQQLAPGQPYGPGPQYGGPQQLNGPQQYPGQPTGTGFGGGAYGGPTMNGPMADGQTYAGPMPYPGDPQQYGQPQPGGTGQRGGLRGRGPLIPALAIGAVAAIVIVALVLVNHHSPGSPSSSASSGSTGASATAGSSGGTAEQAAATQLNTLLAQSGKYRAEVNVALDDVLACKSLRPARDAFAASATNRRNLLTQLAALPGRSALPPALLQDLTTAWQASIQVDSDFRAWAQDEIGGGCNPKKVTSDPNYQASNQFEGPASSNKAKFAQAWKPIAAKYGLPAYTQFQI